MTTKKIDGNQELQTDLLRNIAVGPKKKKGPSSVHEALDQEQSGDGIVDVSLASAINAQLNPESMASERRAKIEKLKELIANKQYNPSSELVAEALQEDIVAEILFSGGSNNTAFEGDN